MLHTGMNLFNRVILQSGSALSPWAMASTPTKTAYELANAMSCPLTHLEAGNTDTGSVVRCLRNVSYAALMNAELSTSRVSGHKT